MRVLVSELEPLWRRTLFEYLTDRGHDVDAAESFATVRDCVDRATEPYDLALLDLQVADRPRLDLVIGVFFPYPGTRLVLVSAHEVERPRHPMLIGRVNRWMRKPVALREIEALLADVPNGGATK